MNLVRYPGWNCYAPPASSDESPDTRTQEMVRNFLAPQVIRYVRNSPGLGRARNVNQLFNLGAGELLASLPQVAATPAPTAVTPCTTREAHSTSSIRALARVGYIRFAV